jgi:hypothetical protein
MKQITKLMRDAFLDGKPFRRDNTEVAIEEYGVAIYLFGNKIAFRFHNSSETMITNCGWDTKTTKERLNALPNVHIRQKNFTWYLNGEQWSGTPTIVKL